MRIAARLLGCAIALAVSTGAALAEDYPNRPITMIVPFPPGASTDTLARLTRDGMSELLGQAIIIDNRGGAGGTTGSAIVASSPPDGYTLLLPASASLTMNPFMQKNYPFDPRTGLSGISFIAESTLFLCVHPSLPVHNVAELIAYARQNPGKLSYGTAGVGSGHHIAGELMKQKTGIDMVHVPYRGGGPATQDLVAGNIPVAFVTAPAALPQAAAGKIRIIASVRRERDPDLPDVPTISETIPGIGSTSWFGLFAPAGTPAPIIEKLHGALTSVLRKPDVAERFKLQGLKPWISTPAELDDFVKSEMEYWGKVIPSIGLEPS
ncbi:MAG: Bug family tripartite tricarboxylate transporter substrate binding protein [Xanthobacteraceae bacterium]